MKRYVSSEILSRNGALNAVSLRVPGLPRDFSMRRTGDGQEASNRRNFFAELGFDESNVARVGQVHSDRYVVVQKGGNYPESDALITTQAGVPLAISVADCVPILMIDTKCRAAAAVHAGWRGTSSGIASKTLDYFLGALGSDPENVYVYVGPSAGQCCYEVGEDVSRHFSSDFLKRGKSKDKSMLDLKAANAEQLIGKGIPRDNIEVSGSCTICNPDFHSFRRDGESSGRMIATIVLK